MISLSVIYAYYNTPEELIKSIKALQGQRTFIRAEIIVVDNNSPLPIPDKVARIPRIKIIRNKINKGFGTALNQGSDIAKGKYLIYLNPDTLVPQNFLKKIYDKMESDKKIGIVGVRYKDGKGRYIKSVGGLPSLKNIIYSYSILYKVFPKNKNSKEYWLDDFDYKKEQSVPVIGGACMVVRADVFKHISGFDEQFFMYFEEADLSLRFQKAGYRTLFYPDITITHFVGRSSSDKELIQRRFEESRFKFIQKYNGTPFAFLAEAIIRLPTVTNTALISIFALSLFLNLYKIDSLIMFYGDFGRDYLVALNMLETRSVPLRGIPSSVVWLHQGPLSIYFISVAFFLGNLNPVAPAILYGVVGSISTLLTYKVGKIYFNKYVGLLAAVFYATSPLVVINARMPYHTSPIPFFTLILFYVLYKILKGHRTLMPLLSFLLGLLFLLELSNSVLIVVIAISFFIYRIKPTREELAKAIVGFILGAFPFILYDIQNKFIQTGGFVLWVVNRVRLFFDYSSSTRASREIGEALSLLWGEVSRILYPGSSTIVAILIILSTTLLVLNIKSLKRSSTKSLVVILWLIVPLIGFLIHAKPGTAYTPVLFPSIAIIFGFVCYKAMKVSMFFLIPFLGIIIINAASLTENNYYLTSSTTKDRPELVGYSYGFDLALRNEVAQAIVKNANNRPFIVRGGGYLEKISTGVDNYKYLVSYMGGKLSNSGGHIYRIYEDKKEVKNKRRIIYENKYIAVTKDE